MAGFVVGLLVVPALALELNGLALLAFAANRVADGLDLASERRQTLCLVHRTQLVEQLVTIANQARIGRIDLEDDAVRSPHTRRGNGAAGDRTRGH